MVKLFVAYPKEFLFLQKKLSILKKFSKKKFISFPLLPSNIAQEKIISTPEFLKILRCD